MHLWSVLGAVGLDERSQHILDSSAMKREELLERAPVSVSSISAFAWAKVERTASLQNEIRKELPLTRLHAMPDSGRICNSKDAHNHECVPYAIFPWDSCV